jgi:hypothetical protein
LVVSANKPTSPDTLQHFLFGLTMHKSELDKHFTDKIEMFRLIARGLLYKQNKRHLTTDTVVNEAYMYAVKNKSIVSNENELERLVINWIKMNIGWNRSNLNRHEMLESVYVNDANHIDFEEDKDEFSYNKTITKNVETEDTIDECLTDKIELEKWYNEKKSLLQLYRYQEEDKIKQIIFDCYFMKNITKGKELSKHLNINTYYAYRYIRELKQDIKDFLQENNL